VPCTIRTPFFTLVSDGKPLRRLLVISKKWRVFIFVFHTPSCVEVTIDSDLVRKPGFAPGPSASRAEMLLLHHNPESDFKRKGRKAQSRREFFAA